jgi:hypothetical protein
VAKWQRKPTSACEICGAKLYSRPGYEDHMCLLHGRCEGIITGSTIIFGCAFCGARFDRRQELQAHLAGHARNRAAPRGE